MSADSRNECPTRPEEVTPDWLTAQFQMAGVLPNGAVTAVQIDAKPKWRSTHVLHLTLDFSPGAPAEAPRHVLAKIIEPEENRQFADLYPGEVAFYDRTWPDGMPLVRCFASRFDRASGYSCLILEDISATHIQPQWPLPPSLEMCHAAVTALAQVHRLCWDRRDLQLQPKNERAGSAEYSVTTYARDLLPAFLDFMGDRLALERHDTMRAVLDRVPDLLARRTAPGTALTLTHGDAHFWNVLYPKDLSQDRCRIIDWEGWFWDVGAFDLAYMVAVHWYPERRRLHEADLLRIYHDALGSAVTSSYGLDDLMMDYRLGLLANFFVPVYQWDAKLPAGIWWPHLERLFMSFEDLECRALL